MKSKALRIGVIGSGDDSSSKLLRLLVEQGMQVVHALVPKELTDAHIAASDLDVWLLDLDDSHWHDQLDELMDRSPVPIFFNEHQSIEGQQHLDYWCRNLISRMFELVADVPGLPTNAAVPAPAAVARGNETLHIAFPQKTESKPSDELNAPPAALDPELLQEIEELEHLLHSKTDHAAEFGELDDELPALTDAKPAAPASGAGKSSKPASEPKPALEPKAAAPAVSNSAAAAADDPVAAAKIRAAKIQQQVAAAAQAREPATLTEVKPPIDTKPASAPVVPAAVTIPATVAATKPAPAQASEATDAKPIAAKPTEAKPAEAKPAEAKPAEAKPAEAKPAEAKPVATKPTESRPTETAVTTNKPSATAPANVSAPKPLEQSLDATLAAAAAAQAPELPPEKHDWPSFPQPAVSGAVVTDEPAADFAPIQPPVAPGPMREPVRTSPMSLVRNVAPEAAASKSASGTGTNAAATKTEAPIAPTVATPYSEPVPTLTVASDDEFEFEFVDQSAIDEPLPHVELDVPMLESVALAGEFEAVAETQPSLPCDLWILGASLGGPAALKRFFTALNQPLPICFLLAQHIDAHFLPVLGKILEQANPFYPVQVLVRPGLIEPGTLLLAPIEKRLRFLDAGQIVHSSRTWTPPYSPCIDDVLADVAGAYPGQVHTIVFSGMGEDGVDGARAVAACRGEVWVQDTDSCASSVMPDAIDKAGLARYRATPEELAVRLMARYNSALGSQSLA